MAKKPTKDYTHKVVEDTNYYRKVPREGDKPNGVFLAGTRVNILDKTAGYLQVGSDTHVKKAWISWDSTLELLFTPTYETSEDTPYWFAETPDIGPPDGTLAAGTKVQVTWWEDIYARIRWFEGGPEAVINTYKSGLKPLDE
jgi:hypothetical protein